MDGQTDGRSDECKRWKSQRQSHWFTTVFYSVKSISHTLQKKIKINKHVMLMLLVTVHIFQNTWPTESKVAAHSLEWSCSDSTYAEKVFDFRTTVCHFPSCPCNSHDLFGQSEWSWRMSLTDTSGRGQSMLWRHTGNKFSSGDFEAVVFFFPND